MTSARYAANEPLTIQAWLIPLIGCVLSTALFLSPLRGVRQQVRMAASGTGSPSTSTSTSTSSSSFNPLPYPLMFLNCLAWLQYGLLIRDYWVFSANIVGIAVSLWYTVGCIRMYCIHFMHI